MNKQIPTQEQNKNGLHKKYLIKRILGIESGSLDYSDRNGGNRGPSKYITKDVDPEAEYFVMRLDDNGKDQKHVAACRVGIHAYANAIKDHLPQLAKDLIERYPLK